MSTASLGTWTYRITEPRMKQFLTDACADQTTGTRSAYEALEADNACRDALKGRGQDTFWPWHFLALALSGPGTSACRSSTHHVRVLDFVDHGDVGQLEVQVLVHRVELAPNAELILELDNDRFPDQRLEERVEQLCGRIRARRGFGLVSEGGRASVEKGRRGLQHSAAGTWR